LFAPSSKQLPGTRLKKRISEDHPGYPGFLVKFHLEPIACFTQEIGERVLLQVVFAGEPKNTVRERQVKEEVMAMDLLC
jgi:hypothetical protein